MMEEEEGNDENEDIFIISIDEVVLVFHDLTSEKYFSPSSCEICRIVGVRNASTITLRSLFDEKIIHASPSNLLDSGDDWIPSECLDSLFANENITHFGDEETELVNLPEILYPMDYNVPF